MEPRCKVAMNAVLTGFGDVWRRRLQLFSKYQKTTRRSMAVPMP